jgi:hypothetical protein
MEKHDQPKKKQTQLSIIALLLICFCTVACLLLLVNQAGSNLVAMKRPFLLLSGAVFFGPFGALGGVCCFCVSFCCTWAIHAFVFAAFVLPFVFLSR